MEIQELKVLQDKPVSIDHKPIQANIINKKPADNSSIKAQDYFINIGPQHPSTHGVLHLRLKLDGETAEDIEPVLGYIHRGIEKMCEKETYRQIIHLTSRLDYLSAHINNQAFAIATEKLLQVEVPTKARIIRILMSELSRLASHHLWWGVFGMELGALTPYFYGFRDREMITDIFEDTCGSRLTMNYVVPGGVMHDLHPDFIQKVKKYITQFKSKTEENKTLLTDNRIFRERTIGVGYLSPEDILKYGVTGPVARASGVSCDVRKHHPYDDYDKLNFREALKTEGDCFARYIVRLEEMEESIRIIEQLIDNIPEGDFQAKVKNVIKPPAGEIYQRVEAARGEFAVYLVSDGSNKPYRVKFRSPGFSNLFALKAMVPGQKLADLIAILGSIDLVIPDIDR
jgi:NADH-quinone oxidoreductase subunit D